MPVHMCLCTCLCVCAVRLCVCMCVSVRVCVSLYWDCHEGGTATRARTNGGFFPVDGAQNCHGTGVLCRAVPCCVCACCLFVFPLKHCDEVGTDTRARGAYGVFSSDAGPKIARILSKNAHNVLLFLRAPYQSAGDVPCVELLFASSDAFRLVTLLSCTCW